MTSNDIFFSIIIPTYNPRKFLPRLLKSITHNECLKNIEVIISDDCSTESFDDILAKFTQLNIVKIENDKHYGFPRNGRQNGVDKARGKWFVFSDQDDYFVDRAFDKVYKFIMETNVKNVIITDFIEEIVATGKQILRKRKSGWTHGKVFEKSFWQSNDIRYDDMQYCEDINLTNIISCIMLAKHLQAYEFNEPLYVWCRRKDSLSDMEYFRKSMPDYINATLGVIIRYVEKYLRDSELIPIFNARFIVTVLHVYFYYQSKQLNDSRAGLLQAIATLQPIYTKFKELTGFTNEGIVDLINNDLMMLYNQTRDEDFHQIPFVEQITFKDWLNLYLD